MLYKVEVRVYLGGGHANWCRAYDSIVSISEDSMSSLLTFRAIAKDMEEAVEEYIKVGFGEDLTVPFRKTCDWMGRNFLLVKSMFIEGVREIDTGVFRLRFIELGGDEDEK